MTCLARRDTDSPIPGEPRQMTEARPRFVATMLDWLNRKLAPPGVTIEAETPLFRTGLIDSIRILELIAWTERATGRVIADREIRMDNFRTVARIADVFVRPGDMGVAQSGGAR
jgi:acyl carrier protein